MDAKKRLSLLRGRGSVWPHTDLTGILGSQMSVSLLDADERRAELERDEGPQN